MKNVTIAIDDEIHRNARIRAAEMGTSLSALVRDYLVSLDSGSNPDGGTSPELREMPLPYHAAPLPPASAVIPKVFTKDGKPRKPGALRGKIWVADDVDEWPDGFLDAMEGNDTKAAASWWKPFAEPPEKKPV